ncbi:sulfatase-like hydrolase/transferase [candidate division KSB1 bacterium]|nr:sulfatase-like hydrolase/transferase [candidate division KSB1 bacterium]NIR69462.1 sulfatase-like hydrolase/transferase [candidate division KSB1 bacterium]NIS22811.1 sulfatase-like hydrolase/transferase [candidate division KSB1 bacterium]NIT69651.1 sulfatase-like hydrolase/transferase [candidate division KSB1 bacterium]NIU23320.1 sulfatase-like hydrolase/transferase [candidate division KSB1 bacterium]
MNKKPNILFIVMDSVRARNLSCYGYHRNTTPNLDEFASEGAIFEQAISESCWTLPVHTSLFTGLYPMNHGVTVSQDDLPDNFPTLARLLNEHGYQTCCISNNAYISKGTGLTQGFEEVKDIWRLTHPRGTKRTLMSRIKIKLKKFGKLSEPLIALMRLLRHGRKILRETKNSEDSGAYVTNESIKKWLTESWDEERPFFMFVNYMECHEKYNPPYPYDRKFMPSRFSRWRVLQVNPDKEKILESSEKKKAEDLEIMKALYDGELNYLDMRIGELIDYLNSQGILENTVTVITSDHGDSLGEHDELGHRRVLYEQLIHVPLLIRYPRVFTPGTHVKEQVQLSDLYPTFLDLTEVKSEEAPSNGFRGLCDFCNGRKREFTISENTAPKSLNSMRSRTIRTDKYKFIWNSNGMHELYDLRQDPNETKNIIRSKPKVAARLQQKLNEWVNEHEDFKVEKCQAVYDSALSERLKVLGYID